jgi:hypothetical protein
MMSINPLNTDATYNHTLVHDDDYVMQNLVEVHIYIESNDILSCVFVELVFVEYTCILFSPQMLRGHLEGARALERKRLERKEIIY